MSIFMCILCPYTQRMIMSRNKQKNQFIFPNFMQSFGDDIFTMPLVTVKSQKTVEDILLESDITKEFQAILAQTSNPNGNRQYLNSSQHFFDDPQLKNHNFVDDDLMLEELIKTNDNNLEEILRDISKDDLFISDKISRKISEQIIPRHILDYINEQEKEPYKQMAVDEQSFLFTHYGVQQCNSFVELKIDKIQNQIYELVSQNKNVNRPRCLQYYNDSLTELIAIGTSMGHISIFILKGQSKFQGVQLPSDPGIQKCCTVAIEFNHNGSILAAINQAGQVILYNISPVSTPKIIKIFSKVAEACPLNFKIYNNSNYLVSFCSADTSGVVQLVNIRKSTFSYGIEKNILFNKSTGIIYQLELMKIKILKSSKFLEAMGMTSLDLIMVVVVDPFIDIVFKRQYHSPYEKKRRLCSRWKCRIFIYLLKIPTQ